MDRDKKKLVSCSAFEVCNAYMWCAEMEYENKRSSTQHYDPCTMKPTEGMGISQIQ